MFPAVTCVIPGGKTPAQVDDNTHTSDLPELTHETMQKVAEIYSRRIKPLVHHYW